MAKYSKFSAMIATSTLAMFGLMYPNTYSLDHVFFSETRAFMALIQDLERKWLNEFTGNGQSRSGQARYGGCIERYRT